MKSLLVLAFLGFAIGGVQSGSLVANPEAQAWPTPSFCGKPFWPVFSKLCHSPTPHAEISARGLEDLPLTQEYASSLRTHRYRANVTRYVPTCAKNAQGRRLYCEPAPAEGFLAGTYTLRDLFGPVFGDYLYTGDWTTRDLWNPQRGHPFILNVAASRPCFFLDGEDRGDKADFARWAAAHPEFLGFYTMGEIDSETANYIRAMNGGGDMAKPEGAIREDFERRFPLPKDRYDFLRFMRACWDTEVKFHFGVDRFWPLYCNNHTLAHINAKMGAVGLQAEISSSQGSPWTWSGAYTRGASRQWGIPFTWYCATFYRGFTRNQEPNTPPVTGDNKWPRDGKHTKKRPAYHGASLSLTARQKHYGWLIGAAMIEDEPWTMLCASATNGVPCPSPYAKVFNDVYVRSTKIDRGAPLTPIALLTPLTECIGRGGYVSGKMPDGRLANAFNLPAYYFTLQPVHEENGKYPMLMDRRRQGDEGCLFNSPFGEIWDVLVADAGMADGRFAAVLAHYPAAFLIGTYRPQDLDRAALEAYVKGGGTLFLSADYILDGIVDAAFAGVSFAAETRLSGERLLDETGMAVESLAGVYKLHVGMPAEGTRTLLADEKAQTVAYVRALGRGRVVTTCADRSMPAFYVETPYAFDDQSYRDLRQKIISDNGQLGLIRYLLDRVQRETIPVKVEGDVQWGVNKVEKRGGGGERRTEYLVWLINNKGVVKFVGEPQELVPTKTARVSLAMRNVKDPSGFVFRDADTGETVDASAIEVAPGDVRFITVSKR